MSRARVSAGGLKSNPSALLELLLLLSALLARSRVRLERLLWARWYWRFPKHPPQLSTPLCVLDMSTVIQRPSFASLAASERVRRSCVL